MSYFCLPVRSSRYIILALFAVVMASGCTGSKEIEGFSEEKEKSKKYLFKSKYEKLLLSDDIKLKHEKGKEYYNKGEYAKALPIFEQLLTLLRGTKTEEELRYYISYCHYGQGELQLASYLFKRFYLDFSSSEFAPDAMFMTAECLFYSAPQYYLDQTSSEKAVTSFRQFINTYPTHDKVTVATERVEELRGRMEKKVLKSAELYYNLGSYQAAAVTYENLLKDFPSSKQAEDIRFLVLKSKYLYANQSITKKKVERFEDAVEAYNSFIMLYPESKFKKEAEEMFQASTDFLETGKNP